MHKQFAAENLTVGMEIPYGEIEITKDEIIEFAEEFDPAPFHIDEQAAKESLLGGLAASGFQTCAIAMKMMCDAFISNSTSQGAAEIEEIHWHLPVRPGDRLSGKSILLDKRQSSSRPGLSVARFRNETYNQNGELVLTTVNVGFFLSRDSQA